MNTRRVLVSAAACALALACGRVALESRAELRASARAEEAGDLWNAAIHAERALHWYLPGAPWPQEAARALVRLAGKLDARGDGESALDAWRMLRSGVLSIRSLYQPMPERLRESEEEIAARMARDTTGAWPDPGLPEDARRAELLANLRTVRDPSPGWVVVVEAGFLTWVGGAAAFCLRAFRGEAGWDGRAAARWGAVVVAGYAAWIVGMVKA